jgi:ferritin-like metal-binding protein YciE
MNLRNLFLDELADMYDAEHRITKALPKLAKAAQCDDLKQAFLSHLAETEGQISKIEQVFAAFDEKPKAKKCKATVGLLEEGDEIASENKGEITINAALVSAGQKVEHYEIASYGCLHAWATALGNTEAADLIQEILDEEKAANDKLNELSKKYNEESLGTDESEDMEKPARFKMPAKNGKAKMPKSAK